jgi:hypothetical protein
MKGIEDTLRAARAARLSARRGRAQSKSLRAWLRAQWLIGRAIKRQCRDLRARVETDQLIARLRALPPVDAATGEARKLPKP